MEDAQTVLTRKAMIRIVSCIVLTLAALVLAKTMAAQVIKQPQAIAVAQRALAVMAPSGLQSYTDSMATGTLTLYEPQQRTFPITLKTKGLNKARTDLQLSDGLNTLVINRGEAVVQHGSQARKLLGNNFVGWQPRYIPALSLLLNYNDANTSAEHLGTEPVSGSAADIVAISFSPTPDGILLPLFHKMSRTTFNVDQSSGLVTRVKYPVALENSPRDQREAQVFYSDYRAVQGIMVPFHQVKYVNGKIREELRLVSISFNVGLQDSEFTLPAVR